MAVEAPARRHSAVEFPEIESVRLKPPGASATLVNLSATGALVECASRALPGSALTIEFLGSFSPASIGGRVVRCEVCGIAADGTLRYHLGLAFSARIVLANDGEASGAPGEAVRSGDSGPAKVPPASSSPVLRNRW